MRREPQKRAPVGNRSIRQPVQTSANAEYVLIGYFADSGYKDVQGLADVGYPIAEVEDSGEALISKTPNSGGLVSTATGKEQLLYELHDPARCLTPDVTAVFTGVRLTQAGQNVVWVTG